jgi:predicted GNAT family acetyltransferase
MAETIIDNKEKQQFELHLDGEVARLEYRWYGRDLALMYTWVPEHLRLKGIGSRLAQYAFEYAKEKEHMLIIYCDFISAFLKSHPEYAAVVSRDYTTE